MSLSDEPTTTTTTTGTAPEVAPLSSERIRAVLEARGAQYGVDERGNIGGYWDGHLFYFFLLGQTSEYLQVRARWNRRVPASELDALTRLVNEWNAEKFWPKLYTRVEDSGVGVYAEHTVDYELGITDGQLDLHIACTIATAGQAFEGLDASYPAEAAAAAAAFSQS